MFFCYETNRKLCIELSLRRTLERLEISSSFFFTTENHGEGTELHRGVSLWFSKTLWPLCGETGENFVITTSIVQGGKEEIIVKLV